MVFRKLLGAMGVGGPSVDTVVESLEKGPALPGGTVEGRVLLEGGRSEAVIEQITLELVARVEAEGGSHGEGEAQGTVSFGRFTVGGGFRLAEGEHKEVPFGFTLPWETPLTELYGQQLGVVLGVRTELEIAGARDKGDLDPLAVGPLPVQEAVLEALGQLGYGFRSADLELGHVRGTGQELPFYQEIELTPPAHHAHAVNEVEVTFVAGPHAVEVVVEADKRGGLFTEGHDVVNSFTLTHEDAARADLRETVDAWLDDLMERRHGAHGAHAGHGFHDPGHGHDHDHGHGHGHSGHGSRGPGIGTAVAVGAVGVAAGVAGGLVAAEVVDEIGDAFEDDDEGDDGGDEG